MQQLGDEVSSVDVTHQNRRAWLTAALCLGGFFGLRMVAGPQPEIRVPQIDLEAAKELIDQGAKVIDVRGQEPYAEAHLPMAVMVPLEVLRTSIPAWLAVLKDAPVVVYCGNGSTLGPKATKVLVDAGFSKAVNLTSGLSGWRNAGYPVISA
jgi:rhodanese-related sulfurtransferase